MTVRTHDAFPGCEGVTYLLLECTKERLQRIYTLEGDPDPQPLFAHTELDLYQAQSPLLVRSTANGELLRDYAAAPATWPGILVSSSKPAPELLTHLRRLLFVNFDGNRKALLRYYDPRTASYLLPACDAQGAQDFLGPIQQLTWYGGTWADSAKRLAQWRSLRSLDTVSQDALPSPWTLQPQQASALERLQLERFAYDWHQATTQQQFAVTWRNVQQGLAAGFEDAESLKCYLDLRAQYPERDNHPIPPAGQLQQRLQQLRAHLEVAPTSMELQA